MKMKLVFKVAVLSLLFVAAGARSSFAAGSDSDFNGDGVSDITDVVIDNSGALSWKVYALGNSSLLGQMDSFGKNGDNLAIGNWFSPTQAALAYTTAPSGSTAAKWVAVNSQGSQISKTLGIPADIFVSGADFNGNGLADAAVIRFESSGGYMWFGRTDFFASRSAIKAANRALQKRLKPGQRGVVHGNFNFRLGTTGDVPFFVNPDAKGDWPGIFHADSTGGGLVTIRNPYARVVRRFKVGSEVSGSLRPLPVALASGKDILCFAIRSSSATSLICKNLRGETVAQTTLQGTGELLVGDYDNNRPGQEIAMQTGSGFIVYNPTSNDTTTATLASHIVADTINITTFTATNPGGGSGGTGGGGGDSGSSCTGVPGGTNTYNPTGALASACSVIHRMDHSVLYKPGSGGTADSRTGKPAFLWYEPCNNPHVPKLDVLASNGTVIGAMGLYAISQYPLVRFYSGYSPGSFDSGPSFASKATAAAGNQSIYVRTAEGNCWGPITNPNARSGGK